MRGLASEADALRRWGKEFATASLFLTRLPLEAWMPKPLPPLAEAMRAFPVAGALIGLSGGAILAILAGFGAPPLLAGALTLGSLALLTGALHEDGLADMADGLGGGRNREDALAIMRDSRIGTYGVITLIVVMIARAASFAHIADGPWYAAPMLLAAAGAFSRALIVWLMGTTLPARFDGLSASAGQPSWDTVRSALLIGGLGGGALLALAGGIIMALVALAIGWGSAAIARAMAERRIGGQTGDICGAVQALSEAAMLATSAVFLNVTS